MRPASAPRLRASYSSRSLGGQSNTSMSPSSANTPCLPGYNVNSDPLRQDWKKRNMFKVTNGFSIEAIDPLLLPSRPRPMSAKAPGSTSDFTEVGDPRWETTQSAFNKMHRSHSAKALSGTSSDRFVPPHVSQEKKVLRFYGYYLEPITESSLENFRVRKLVLYYYLVDDTVAISEPRETNSGVPQGQFLKRQRLPYHDENGEEESRFYMQEDFAVGCNIEVYGKVVRLVDADPFTRDHFTTLGVSLAPAEEYPKDHYREHEKRTNKLLQIQAMATSGDMNKTNVFGIRSFIGAHPKDARKLLEMDRKVLQFEATYDDKEMGYLGKYIIFFFLADDTVEISEVQPPNCGKDPQRKLLKRSKLPRTIDGERCVNRIGHPNNDCYGVEDFRVGQTIVVYNRVMTIVHADPFTQEYYLRHFNIDQNAAVLPPTLKPRIRSFVSRPPVYSKNAMYGGAEDSLRTCQTLRPKAPRTDRDAFDALARLILRFSARLLTDKPHDQGRKFVVAYYPFDETTMIFEPTQRNSGISGGRFVERQKLVNPDAHDPARDQVYYTYEDFYAGNVLKVASVNMLIEAEDSNNARAHEEIKRIQADKLASTNKSSMKDLHGGMDEVDVAEKKLKRCMLQLKHAPRWLFENFDPLKKNYWTAVQVGELLKFFGIVLDTAQTRRLFERWDQNQDGILDYNEFYQYVRRFGMDALTAPLSDVDSIRARVHSKMAERRVSLRAVTSSLSWVDETGAGRLSLEEVKNGLTRFEIYLQAEEIMLILRSLVPNAEPSPYIEVSVFMQALRGELNATRKAAVKAAFDGLNLARDGRPLSSDLKIVFDGNAYRATIGAKGPSPDQSLLHMVSQWDVSTAEGYVTYELFEDYYRDLSLSIGNDHDFVELLNRTWGLRPEFSNYGKRLDLHRQMQFKREEIENSKAHHYTPNNPNMRAKLAKTPGHVNDIYCNRGRPF